MSGRIGEPSHRRQQEEEQQQGYDKSKHGPVAFADLDPEVQGILIAIKRDIKSLSTRAGGPAPGRGASEVEVTSYFERIETLAEETVQDIIEKAKQHPILTRALTEDRECLLQLFWYDFQLEYGHAYHFSSVAFLKHLKNKTVLSLVQENPFSLLYQSTKDLFGRSIEEGKEDICIWVLLSYWGLHGPTTRFVFDNPSLRWMFEHLPVHSLFDAVEDSFLNGDTDWAKGFITDIFPDTWLDRTDREGNTLLHRVCGCIESFDGEFNQWMMQENPSDQFGIENEDGETPLHEICHLVTQVPDPPMSDDGVVVHLSREKEAALTIKSIVERFPDTAKVQEHYNATTPFLYILFGLASMYNESTGFSNDYRVNNHFDDHIELVIDVAESMLRSAPQVVSIGNGSKVYPLDTLERVCHRREVQDLVELICRIAYPSIEYFRPNAFYASLRETLDNEASLAKTICDMKRVQLLLIKANKTPNSKLNEKEVECYGLWAEDRIRKLSASIKTIQDVEIPNLKERFSRPQE